MKQFSWGAFFGGGGTIFLGGLFPGGNFLGSILPGAFFPGAFFPGAFFRTPIRSLFVLIKNFVKFQKNYIYF